MEELVQMGIKLWVDVYLETLKSFNNANIHTNFDDVNKKCKERADFALKCYNEALEVNL